MAYPSHHPESTSFATCIAQYHAASLTLLISDKALMQVKKLGQQFPMPVSSFWGYELPLYTDERKCDFLFCVHDAATFRKAFLQEPAVSAGPAFFNTPAYKRLAALSAAWAAGNGMLQGAINNIWLEYDFADLLKPVPLPNFFYAPKGNSNGLETALVCQQVFSHLLEMDVPASTYRLLLQCNRRIDGEGFISQIGMMLARNETHLRLYIQGLPGNGILSYLKKTGYAFSGNAQLITVMNKCCAFARHVGLDIDIAGEVGDKIGLECYFDSTEAAIYFLDEMYNEGLCVAGKYVQLKAHLRTISYDKNNVFQHFFSHFKLVYAPASGISLKAYMGFAAQHVALKLIHPNILNQEFI